MPYIELEGESRGYSVTNDSVTQTFVYRICNEDTDESDDEFGAFFAPNDDVGIAKFVYATFPVFRVFPISVTENITLYITSHSAKEDSSGWVITLVYGIPTGDAADPTYVQFGIDFGGETLHINKGISVLNSASRTGSSLTPPETYGLIGVTNQDVTGVDIVGKGLNFNITSYFDASVWSIPILQTFYTIQGTVNAGPFYGFKAGEVLCLSISAQGDSSYKKVPVTFNFNAKPNVVNLPDYGFANLTANGQDIVDYLYSKAVDENSPVQWPTHRFVHRVYERTNFNLLGIGSG